MRYWDYKSQIEVTQNNITSLDCLLKTDSMDHIRLHIKYAYYKHAYKTISLMVLFITIDHEYYLSQLMYMYMCIR